ncbi:MAG: alpha/beta fold hydrolase [Elusimicrobia bacterium]|nr:alpha/beta fold hydrolase [Elusimicrobiota bacterium]
MARKPRELPLFLPALFLAAALGAPAVPAHAGAPAAERAEVRQATTTLRTVFLMHGILRSSRAMKRIETALRARGFSVVNLGYPSRSRTVEEHADWLAGQVRERGRGELYFVGHSLGAIVMRRYLGKARPAAARRLVMIAPPNRGSAMADTLSKTGLYRLIFGGKAAQELRSSRKDFWEGLPPPPVEFGIIAGGLGNGKGFNPLLPGDDDGTLSVEETRLEGASDFRILPYQHTLILLRRRTAELTVRFLETGKFGT